MAKYAVFQITVTDDAGNVVPFADIEVRAHTTGQPLAVLYADRAGTTPLGNPVAADANGFIRFYLKGGAYQITATSGDFSRQWLHNAIGTAAEFDLEAFSGFDTNTSVGDALIDSAINTIRTNGFTAVGIGEADYMRVSSEPSHVGKIQSADSTWWEVFTKILRPQMFGDADDDLTNALAVSAAQGGRAIMGNNWLRIATITVLGTLLITPAAASLTRGLDIQQNVAGTAATYTSYNRILISSDVAEITTAGGVGVGLDIAHIFGGGAEQGARSAVQILARRSAASNAANALYQDVGLGFGFSGQSNNNGTGGTAKGAGYGGYLAAQLTNNATYWDILAGFEMDSGIEAGSSAKYLIGLQLSHLPTHAVNGSVFNSALSFTDPVGPIGWPYVITFNNTGGQYPCAVTGTLIASLGAQTVAAAIDFNSLTCTYLLRGPSDNFVVSGDGHFSVSSATASVIAGTNSAPLIIKPVGVNNLPQLDSTIAASVGLDFKDQGNTKWYFLKNSSNSLIWLDNVLSKTILWSAINTGVVTFGVTGANSGLIDIAGSSTGLISLKPQAAAGTYNWNWPTGAGTAGQPLLSGGGAAAAMTFGTLGIAAGGTNATAQTTNGIGYFDGTKITSSSLMTWDGVQAFALASNSALFATYENVTSNAGGSTYLFRKARGTIASKTIVTTGDVISSLSFQAWDGAGYQSVAAITAAVTGTVGAGATPGLLSFYTTPASSSTPALQLSIDQTGLATFTGSVVAATYKVGANQVVGARNAGWTAQTATASKADLGASPTVGALAQWASAIDALLRTSHGLIGA